jgi:hypothetical protein
LQRQAIIVELKEIFLHRKQSAADDQGISKLLTQHERLKKRRKMRAKKHRAQLIKKIFFHLDLVLVCLI